MDSLGNDPAILSRGARHAAQRPQAHRLERNLHARSQPSQSQAERDHDARVRRTLLSILVGAIGTVAALLLLWPGATDERSAPAPASVVTHTEVSHLLSSDA